MMYLRLFHGRPSVDQDMDDWGDDGPIFPCRWVHTTYGTHVRICPAGITQDDGHDLTLVEKGTLIYYDGMYYGDWSVFDPDACPGQPLSDVQDYDPRLSIPPVKGDGSP